MNGCAVFLSIDTLVPAMISSGDAARATIWSTAEVPVISMTKLTGVNVRLVLRSMEIQSFALWICCPGASHRCIPLIDYDIVLSGKVELELDDGAVETCKRR
jgi:uncharacterized cupin superfamily protein